MTAHVIHLLHPADNVPDLSTAGALLRYAHLRAEGFDGETAELLADGGYDVALFAVDGAA